MTFRLTKIANAIAPSEESRTRAATRQFFQNIHTRHRIPVAGREANADLFDVAGAVTFMLISKAGNFGIHGDLLAQFARWLIAANPSCGTDKVGGGEWVRSPAQEAVRRVYAGDDFAFHIVLYRDDTVAIHADWPREESDRVKRAIATAPERPVAAWFTISASDIIRDLLENLER